MFANVRLIGREFRMTPSHVEAVAGRLNRPPKSPLLATRSPRCLRTGRDREGRQARRDDLSRIIQMSHQKNKTPRTGEELGADQAEATNLNSKDTKPASKLLAEADRVIATFPSMMTKKSKHQAQSQVLHLFLSALAASRPERAV